MTIAIDPCKKIFFSRLFGPQDSFVRTPFQENGTVPGPSGFSNPFPDGYSLPNVDFQIFEDVFNNEDASLEEDTSLEDFIDDIVADLSESSGSNDVSIEAVEEITEDIGNIIEETPNFLQSISSSSASVYGYGLLVTSIVFSIIEVFGFE